MPADEPARDRGSASDSGGRSATRATEYSTWSGVSEALPPRLTAGIAALSGHDLSHVRVVHNATRLASFDAQASAQGDEIQLAPGQERHLPHEAWHLVQQRRASEQVAGEVLGDPAREREADEMGARAWEVGAVAVVPPRSTTRVRLGAQAPIQLVGEKQKLGLLTALQRRAEKESAAWWQARFKSFTWQEFLGWVQTNAYGRFKSVDEVGLWLADLSIVKAVDAICAIFGGPVEHASAAVEEDEDARLRRDELLKLIAQMMEGDFERSRRGPSERRVETPVFSIRIRKYLPGLVALRPSVDDVRRVAAKFDVSTLEGIVEEAIVERELWPSRNEFSEEVVPKDRTNSVPFSRYRHTGTVMNDPDYVALDAEVALWNSFLDRHVPLPGHSSVRDMRARLLDIKRRADALVSGTSWSVQRLVGAHALLKAQRMKLSNTVLANNQENLEKGRGDLVAATQEGRQWEATEQRMLEEATRSQGRGKCRVTPELVFEFNALESSEKGLVNSQGPGELRYSAIFIGSKAESGKSEHSYSLRVVPPSMIGPKLAGLISRTNMYLSRIRSERDLWLLIPIASRFFTDFISIHPFPDGNGRTARRIVDYMFMSFGLPPAQFDKQSNNFGGGIPDVHGQEPRLERMFNDEEGWGYVLRALEAAVKTLETGVKPASTEQ